MHQPVDLAQRLEDLRAERRRFDDLIRAYDVVERSKFARVRGIFVSLGKVIGIGADPAFPVVESALSAGSGDAALLAELREAQAGRLDLLDLINAERKRGEGADAFARWLRMHEPRESDLLRLAEVAELLPYRPCIGILMPVYETRREYLCEAIDSVLAQVYQNWELYIADDASSSPVVRDVLSEYAAKDPRIKIAFRSETGGVSRATNTALDLATSEFVGFLDHDDLLTRDALYEVAVLLNNHRDADMIYSDEDKLDERNMVRDPYFKPDWCPDSLLSRMYTSHLSVYRTALVRKAGGLRVGFEGSQDHDLALRISEQTRNIHHIPRILYHWRIHPGSTASAPAAKPYAALAGQKAVQEAIERRGEPGKVVARDDVPGVYLVRYDLKRKLHVTIVVPSRDHGEDVDRCLTSIFASPSYPDFEVLIVDNGSVEASSLEMFARWAKREPRVRVVRWDHPFNYSQINNVAAAKSQGEYLLFLNNDAEVISRDWIEALVEQAQRPSVGVVGGLLLYPDDTIQHAGVVVGLGGIAGHAYKHLPKDHAGYFAGAKAINNVSALTAACSMVRRAVFEELGGFDESLAVSFNDVDLCLKAQAAGYHNVYLPHVVLYHYESKSRGSELSPLDRRRFAQEIQTMQDRWQIPSLPDPCYSIHLTLDAPNFSVRA